MGRATVIQIVQPKVLHKRLYNESRFRFDRIIHGSIHRSGHPSLEPHWKIGEIMSILRDPKRHLDDFVPDLLPNDPHLYNWVKHFHDRDVPYACLKSCNGRKVSIWKEVNYEELLYA